MQPCKPMFLNASLSYAVEYLCCFLFHFLKHHDCFDHDDSHGNHEHTSPHRQHTAILRYRDHHLLHDPFHYSLWGSWRWWRRRGGLIVICHKSCHRYLDSVLLNRYLALKSQCSIDNGHDDFIFCRIIAIILGSIIRLFELIAIGSRDCIAVDRPDIDRLISTYRKGIRSRYASGRHRIGWNIRF